ncbi:MAG: HEPN domain-containing protein [Candidatus Muiribacteriota bacterium]
MVDKQKHIKYWINSSDKNFESMLKIFESGEYMWSIFIGHLSIEKLLKALYVKKAGVEVPRIHDLYKLANKMELEMTENTKDILQLITTFNIEARYDFQKERLYKKCNKSYCKKMIKEIEGIRKWLLSLINK